MTILKTTAATFEQDVLEPAKQGPIVVAFTASWCGPCKLLKPKLEQLADAWGFTLAIVDAGEDKALAAEHGVRAVPTVLTLENGAVLGRFSGDRSQSELEKHFRSLGLAQTNLEF
ncbi:thioredoxin family protein [Ralstonia pickettii]|uniref:thioredoxin family protein n=1 Tax=Ralstonia pickettii TaxID=329 RepID=UPI0027152DAE|nr:thioredoxin family protein [Ralstonia pickettii]WKZ86324.1 thioredoxin family protein [Ralstonia pickettii]